MLVAKEIVSDIVKDSVAPLWQEILSIRHELNKRTDDLEQYSRRNSIRISGVEETRDENVEDVVMDVLKDVHPSINVSNIDRCHRVGKKNSGTKRQIIVKFVSYWDRNKVMRNRKLLKHTKQSVYLNEDLSHYRSKLFKKTRDLKRQKKIHATWTYDGRIHVCEQQEEATRDIEYESDLIKYN
ncbi:uncharacterized protein [Haliotis cracherodii]|uniref:uncharacterized protein n=1 Tax=Haliotis cracherodii TaxID=6455 RepID=UPI0039EB1350